MAIGSGLCASLGWAEESSYGTYAAPTHWAEFNSESLKMQKKIIANEGLRGCSRLPRVNRRVLTTQDAGGSIDLDVSSRGFGLLLAHLMGTDSPTATQVAATGIYRQVHTIGDGIFTNSMTIQVGKPQSDGVVKPFSYVGCKFVNFEMSCGIDEYLNLKAEIDGRKEDIAQPLVAPTYVTGDEEMFHFGQIDVEIGGTVTTTGGVAELVGSEDVDGCKGMSFKHSVPLKVDRYFAGATSLKAQPIENGMRDITGKLSTEFANMAQLYDLFAAETTTALKIRFQGTDPVAGGGGFAAFEVLFPAVRFDTANPNVDGPDVLECEVSFKAYDDASGINPAMQIIYESADATVV